MAEVRGFCTDFIRKCNIKIHANLMSNRREMQHTVCGASQCHIYRQSIQDSFFRHNIQRSDILPVHFHYLHSGMFRQADTLRVDCRNRSVAWKPHSQNFCQAVHAVCCIHTGTGTASGTCLALELIQFFFADRACAVRSHCFKHGGKACFLPLYMPRHHRPSTYKYGRNIDACRRHQKPRHILVTVRHHYQRVKLMRHRHRFCGICNQIPCHQRIFHADMSHSDTITYRNRRKYDRRPASHSYALLHCIYNFIQIHMPRNNFIMRTDNSHQRPFHLLFCHAQRVKQGTVRSLLHSLFYVITFHIYTSSFKPFLQSGFPFPQSLPFCILRNKYPLCGILLSAPASLPLQ